MQVCRLTANKLSCQRGERLLFRGLGLDLASGQALHVKGANGIGKSSLIRILAGLLRPFGGSVERSGTMGLLDERPALDPGLPLAQALGFWQRLDGPGDSELAQLGLSGLAEVPVRYLSTGQKKRAALARLLGQEAAIWLLDEPLNGLDARGVALVEALVAQHCAQGGIALVASHQAIALPGGDAIDLAGFTV
jgi:heme exporter protein A